MTQPIANAGGRPPLGRIGFVGAGAVASALAPLLAARGHAVVAVAAGTPAHAAALAARIPGCRAVATPDEVAAAADCVFLAVPDDAIGPIARGTAWRPDRAVVHLSGSQGAAALGAARDRGARVAALHPLMTFPRASGEPPPVPETAARLAGSAWALEAPDDALFVALAGLVGNLGGRVIRLTAADRVPYHLAAVLASNYVVALLGAAVRLWGGFGVAPGEALAALLPLTRAAVEGLGTVGLPAALTGPVARGDAGTVAAHLAWLWDHADDVALEEAYVALARLALPLARAKGTLSPEAERALLALLDAGAPPPGLTGT